MYYYELFAASLRHSLFFPLDEVGFGSSKGLHSFILCSPYFFFFDLDTYLAMVHAMDPYNASSVARCYDLNVVNNGSNCLSHGVPFKHSVCACIVCSV
ncbi:hypothetical protein GIB67_001355 [Kingdonia uniflora]|uniref:Uncharacterized protein n=1 Tax=Kingdonia uniflora TaxID=39325 RepID=A0A7J7MTX3_9MAGN|nr:hypothetical protein GIB67_001355 [Kingdonia uniflora]